jgi:hypothetical protein
MSEKKVTQIIVCVYNRPDFLIYQYLALCKYMQGPWHYLVVSDAEVDHNDYDLEFKRICRQLNIRHVRMPPYLQAVRGASPRAGNALDWALKNYAYNYPGITIVLDSDMWPVRPFDPDEYMRHPHGGTYDIAGVVQTISHQGYWVRYLWMALIVINGSSPAFKDSRPADNIRFMNAVAVEGLPTDAGGPMHYYLENNPHLRIKPMKHFWSGTWQLDELVQLGWNNFNPRFLEFLQNEKKDPEINGFGEILSDYFYHHRAGSNWNNANADVIERRTEHLSTFFVEAEIMAKDVYVPSSLSLLQKYPIPRTLALLSETLTKEKILKITESRRSTDQSWINMNRICTPEDIARLGKAGYVIRVEDEYILGMLDDNAVSDLILLHESLQDASAMISLSFNTSTGDDENRSNVPQQLIPSLERLPGEYFAPQSSNHPATSQLSSLYFYRPGLPVNKARRVWELSHNTWMRILEKKITADAEATQLLISTEMKMYPLKKQHQYQIVVMGQKLSHYINVQLQCIGDMFFGELDAKEFALNTEPTLISWDFYNKFEDKIAIGLKVTDNRVDELQRKSIPVTSLISLRCAYLTCIGPLH